ncbi:DUF6531 domain-containing protein [Halomonas cupida]|uniref:DUF6531 domain-containing protein n=1 Tax=Halomonas cupida TaxID=44933 RepID=UPI003A9598CF
MTEQTTQHEVPEELRELGINMRVVTSPAYEPPTPPNVEIELEPESSSALMILKEAAYMLPVVGNAMSLADVAVDVWHLCDDDPNGQSNLANPWLWAVLVIDAIGIIPAAGNASRPVRKGAREAILDFIRGNSVETVSLVLWNAAGGDALEFVANMHQWLQQRKPVFQNFITESVGTLKLFVDDPVSGAKQVGMIETNPGFWQGIGDAFQTFSLNAFDRLLDAIGEEKRLNLSNSLGRLGRMASEYVGTAIDDLLPILMALTAELLAHKRRRGGVEHEGNAIPGGRNEHPRSATNSTSTRTEDTPSNLPPGCAATCNQPGNILRGPKPVDHVMGDENLWQTDFRVPGLIDVEWTRYYRSSIDQLDDSELGARWSSPYHLRFEQSADGLIYIDGLNRALPIEPLSIGESRFLQRELFTIEHPDADTYDLFYLDGGSERYERIAESGSVQYTHFRLVEQRERDGRTLTLDYRQGRLASIHDGASLSLVFGYNDVGLLERVVRQYPQSELEPEVLALYSYDSERNLVSHRDSRDYHREYRYQHHLLTHYVNRNGVGAELTWDWPGKNEGTLPDAREARCIRTRLEDGSEDTRFEYHRGLWYTRVTDADGVVTIYRYNWDNYIESLTRPYHPDLGSEYWQWDRLGRLHQHIDGEGRTTQYRYDAEGRISAVTDPQGLTTQIEYDDQGLPARVTNPDGRVRETRFDKRGLPVEEIAPSGRKTTYKHNERGLLTAMTDAAGNTYRYEWNDQGLLVSASDCSQKTTEYHYDHRGHLCEMINAAGHPTRYRLDAGGLPLSIQHADGATETFTHDGEGSLTEYVDPAGQRTRYRYNGKGQPIERRDPLGQTFSYQYDRLLRLSALVNQNGDRWSFCYDGGGHLIEEQGFDGRRKTYQYDVAGALRELHEGDQVTTFKRDSMGRLLERRSERPGLLPVTTQFAYDPLGRLVRAASDDSETQFRFDTADNLIAEVQRHRLPNGSEYSAVTRHTHDALGNRETTTLPDGQQVAWLRYGSGHVHAMALDQQELIGFERDDLHREVGRHQRGREVESRYDPVGRLIAQQLKPAHGQALRRQWHYAENGLLTAVDDSLRGTTQYGYDPLGRLRKAASPVREEHFDFDPAGNLVDPQDQQSSNSTSATRWRGERPSDHLDRGPDEHIRVDYPNAPKLSSAMGNLLKRYAGTHYHYDDFGNLVRRISPNGETWQYRYDPEHRLIEASHYAQAPAAGDAAMPTIQARYGYDGLGRRVWKQVDHQGQSPELTVFTWDGDLLQSEESFQGKPPTAFPARELRLR